MIKPVRKAVFPAAGWGTRFLPATKAQPKEMLPLVDRPVIQYGVEEAVEAGTRATTKRDATRMKPTNLLGSVYCLRFRRSRHRPHSAAQT